MAANVAPVFPKAPVIGIASLVSPTAVTSRANITGTTGLTLLLTDSVEGTRVDKITVHYKDATAASTAASVWVWLYDSTTSFLLTEIPVTVVTGSNTATSFDTSVSFTDLVLPAGMKLYVSTTVDQDFNVFAFGGVY